MILGIDIGGTAIKFGVVDSNYNILKTYSIPTVKDKGDKFLVSAIIEKANEIKKEIDYDIIGIGTPGLIDSENGIILRASNLPFENTPIVEMVCGEMDVFVSLANDARSAASGELYAGVGREYNNFIMITLGTGVGGGIIVDNKLYMGANGGAGEIGHMIIEYGGESCPCGQKGCYEQYASVSALIRQTKEAIEKNPQSLLAQIGKDKITGRTAFDAQKAGCPVACNVVDKYTGYIATGIQSLVRIFQPEVIVIGGAISNEGENLLKPVCEKITIPVKLAISELKNNAGMIGAAALAMQNKKGRE